MVHNIIITSTTRPTSLITSTRPTSLITSQLRPTSSHACTTSSTSSHAYYESSSAKNQNNHRQYLITTPDPSTKNSTTTSYHPLQTDPKTQGNNIPSSAATWGTSTTRYKPSKITPNLNIQDVTPLLPSPLCLHVNYHKSNVTPSSVSTTTTADGHATWGTLLKHLRIQIEHD